MALLDTITLDESWVLPGSDARNCSLLSLIPELARAAAMAVQCCASPSHGDAATTASCGTTMSVSQPLRSPLLALARATIQLAASAVAALVAARSESQNFRGALAFLVDKWDARQ